jgi:rare lipoprotein A
MNSLKLFFATFIFTILMTPLFAASPEFGKATYYNDKYHGKKTASGELYDREKMTCAHKTLKFGTIVRVTRIDNQLSVEVRVNDRGPYSEGFVIDLSYKAAEQIGLVKSGRANVKVEVVEPEVQPSPATLKEVPIKSAAAATSPAEFVTPVTSSVPMKPGLIAKGGSTAKGSAGAQTAVAKAPEEKKVQVDPALYQTSIKKVAEKGFAVQLQSLSSGDVALNEAAKLQAEGIWDGRVLLKTSLDKTGETSYKILLGPFETKKEAETQQKFAMKKGHKKCFVVNLAQ